MGKMIKSASRWTSKSTLLFFNKVISVVFGLFCLVTGQTKSFNDVISNTDTVDYGITPMDTYNFSGKVINSESQAVIENIKVILKLKYEDIIVDYGVQNMRGDTVNLDSVYTDENGDFQISVQGATGVQPYWILEAVDIDSSENGKFESKEIGIGRLAMTKMAEGNVGDTIVNIELDPVEVAINGIKGSSIDCNILTALSGKNIVFTLNNWKQRNGIANIIDIKGRIIQQINIPQSGIFKLNTEGVSKGSYIINIKVDDTNIATKVTIQ